MKREKLKNIISRKKPLNKYLIRLLFSFLIIVIWYTFVGLIFPDEQWGLHSIRNYFISTNPNLDNDSSITCFILSQVKHTMIRFFISIMLVTIISVLFALLFNMHKATKIILDLICESLRTIPATAWALPLAIFLNSRMSLSMYLSIILAAVPILTLGVVDAMDRTTSTSKYILAKINGVKMTILIFKVFIPEWILNSFTHIKTTYSLIFILVVVIETILQSGSIKIGLGVIMNLLYLNSDSGSTSMLWVMFILILAFCGIVISTILDIIDSYLDRFRSKW